MTAKTDGKAPTPEAQLKAWADQFDPKTQKLFRAVRTALRKRFPSANELAYDYGEALVVSYAPADKGIDGLLAIRASTAGVALYFNQAKNLSDPKRLLKGTGKQARFILLESASQLESHDVEALIAATLNTSATRPRALRPCALLRLALPGRTRNSLSSLTGGPLSAENGLWCHSRHCFCCLFSSARHARRQTPPREATEKPRLFG